MAEIIVSGAKFWKFEEHPVFVGVYSGGTVIAEKDDEEQNRKKGDVMGYPVVTKLHPEGVAILPSNHAIEDAIAKLAEKGKGTSESPLYLFVKFLGKEAIEGGRNFSRFKIASLSKDEYEGFTNEQTDVN